MKKRIETAQDRLAKLTDKSQQVQAQIRVLASHLARMETIRDLPKGSVIQVQRGRTQLPAILLAWVDKDYAKARVLVDRGPDSTTYTVQGSQISLPKEAKKSDDTPVQEVKQKGSKGHKTTFPDDTGD